MVDKYEEQRFTGTCPTCGQPFLRAQVDALLAELKAIDDALGTNEGHSSVTHIVALQKERDQYKKYWEIEMIKIGMNTDDIVKNGWKS